jgi:hypothetical protein
MPRSKIRLQIGLEDRSISSALWLIFYTVKPTAMPVGRAPVAQAVPVVSRVRGHNGGAVSFLCAPTPEPVRLGRSQPEQCGLRWCQTAVLRALHPMIEFFALGTAVLALEQEIAPEKLEDPIMVLSVNDSPFCVWRMPGFREKFLAKSFGCDQVPLTGHGQQHVEPPEEGSK